MKLVLADSGDAEQVAEFCQPIYEEIYPNKKYGLTKEHFSPKVFGTKDTLDYFRRVLRNSDNNKAYLAIDGSRILGTINVEKLNNHYEVRCFYVAKSHRGTGVGKKLWDKAMDFCKDKTLPKKVLVAETLMSARSMYEAWGFKKTNQKPEMITWPEWPKNIANAYIWYEK